MSVPLLPATVVGSYPQPDWLVERALLAKGVPREVAFGKLAALAAGAAIVRRERS
jgi:methionine synthase II (cobalamin-independent)